MNKIFAVLVLHLAQVAAVVGDNPQLLHYPKATILTPYNDLKTQTYHPVEYKRLQKNYDTAQAS